MYSDTRTSRLRRRHTQECAKNGQFESQDAKAQRAILTHKQEMQRRAKAHVAHEQRIARQKIQEAMAASHANLQRDSPTANTENPMVTEQVSKDIAKVHATGASNLKEEDRLAEAHRKSRHRKIESDITNMTRDLLAEKGLDVLRFVEGSMTPKQVLDSVRDSVPRNRDEVRIAFSLQFELHQGHTFLERNYAPRQLLVHFIQWRHVMDLCIQSKKSSCHVLPPCPEMM